MGDLNKKSIQDRIKQAYRNAPGDPDQTVKAVFVENSDENPLPVYQKNNILGGIYFDAIDFTYPNQKTEIFKYYSGGIGGNLVATVIVTYYDTGKRKIKSVSKV